MQISAKATFLGFVQTLDPHTRLLEMAGIKIALVHTGGAVAGDFLQVEAVLDDESGWSGVIVSHLINPRAATEPRSAPSPAASEPRLRAQPAAQPISPAPPSAAPRQPAAPDLPAPARSQAMPARRFGVSSSNGPRVHAQAQRSTTRPPFCPTAADERVNY